MNEKFSWHLQNRISDDFVVLVHGGAWAIPNELKEPHRQGIRRAHERVSSLLAGKTDPLEAIVAGLVVLEDDPVFDAGTGSFLNEEGEVDLDAALMSGSDLAAGAVASVGRFANPSRIALELLREGRHVLLVGSGAERFARSRGIAEVEPDALVLPREQEAHAAWVRAGKPDPRIFFHEEGAGQSPLGTVGIVAGVLGEHGRYDLFAGTSTGGTRGKKLGRIGDVPLVGCGIYADNSGAAAVCSGYGEAFMRLVAAHAVSEKVKAGLSPREAVESVLREVFARTNGRGAIMAVDGRGRTAAAFTTPDFAFCGVECAPIAV